MEIYAVVKEVHEDGEAYCSPVYEIFRKEQKAKDFICSEAQKLKEHLESVFGEGNVIDEYGENGRDAWIRYKYQERNCSITWGVINKQLHI